MGARHFVDGAMGPSSLLLLGLLTGLQVESATVAGTVRDEEIGTPLPGALVSLNDLGRAVLTDAEGRYELDRIPPGPQHVTVRAVGYAQRTLHALVPREGTLEIHVALRPEPLVLQGVEADPRVRTTEEGPARDLPFPDHGISAVDARHHPLASEADVLAALGGGVVGLTPESPSGVHVRGGATDQTAFVLDGIPVFNPYHAGALFSAWNPDALTRVQVASAAPSPDAPHVLSGVVEAETRAPGGRAGARGGLSTTQARLTVDGPLPLLPEAGFLVSLRDGFPGTVLPPDEASYLRGTASDLLVTLHAPLAGGRLRLLGYESEDEIDAAATAEGLSSPPRNTFEWHSRSLGGEWRKELSGVTLVLKGWSASSAAQAAWLSGGEDTRVESRRRDEGISVSVERRSPKSRTRSGIDLRRSRTDYAVEPGAGLPAFAPGARTSLPRAFVEHERALSEQLALRAGGAATVATGHVHLGPRGILRWQATPTLGLSVAYARSQQFVQSLRNPESVVGGVFPAELPLASPSVGVPVARSDQGVVGMELRPASGVRVGVQAHERRMEGLVLVAPDEEAPFSTRGPLTGSGAVRSVILDAAVSAARYGAVASYARQWVRLEHEGGTYVPGHGAAHRGEGGMVLFPTSTLSLSLGAVALFGRRGTDVMGGFEWEACNLLDRGCEFGGSPSSVPATAGRTELPSYLRLDLGFRKHWHLRLGGRDTLMGLFGTVTNVFGRGNVLVFSIDPETGERAPVEMRPLAPLVLGLDWGF